jgi:hypothetical protein
VKIEVQLKGFLSPKAVYRGIAVVEDPFCFQKPMLKQVVLSLADIKASSEEDNIPASMQFSIEVTSPSVPNSLQERRRSIIQTVIEKGGGHHLEDSDAAGDNEESSEESDISFDDPKASLSKLSKSNQSLPPIAKSSIKGKPPKIDNQKRSTVVQEFIQSGLVDEDDSNHESGHSDSDHDSEFNSLPPRKSIPMKPVQNSIKDSSMQKSMAQQFVSKESNSDDDSLPPPPASIVVSAVRSPDKNTMLHTFIRKGSIDEDNSNTEEDDSEAEEEEMDTLQQKKRKKKSKVRKDRISREMAVEQLLSNSTLDDEETIHTFDATNDLRLSPDDDSSVVFVVEEQVAPKLSYSQSLSLSMDPMVKNSHIIENMSTFDSHEQNDMYISPYVETLPKKQRDSISEESHGKNEQLKQRFSSEEEDSDLEEEENIEVVKRAISSSRSDFHPKVTVVEDRVVAETDQSNPFFTADSDEDDASLGIPNSDEKPESVMKDEVLINPFLFQNNDSDEDEEETVKAIETNNLEPVVPLLEDYSNSTVVISTEQPVQQRKSLKILFGTQRDETVGDHSHLTKIAAIEEHVPTNYEDSEEEEWEKTVRSNTVAAQETPQYQEQGFPEQSEEQKPEQLHEQPLEQLPSSNQSSADSFLKDQEISLLQNELQTVLNQNSVVATKLEDQSLKENSLLLHIQDLSNKLQTLMLENQENKKTLEKVQREKEELEAHQKEKERLLKEEAVKKEHEKEIEILQSEWLNDRGNQFRLHEEETTVLGVPKNEISILSFQRTLAITVAVENPLLSHSYSSSNLENEINRTSSLDLETAVSTPKSSEEIEILKSKVSAYEEYNNKLQQDLLDMKRKTKSKALIEAALSNMLTRRSLNIPMHKRDSFHDQQLLLQNSIQEGTSPVPEKETDETERPKSTYSMSNEDGIVKNTVPAVNNPTPVRVIERRRGIFDPNTMTLSDITPFAAPESSSSHRALKPQSTYNNSNNNYTITPISSRTTTPLPTHLRGSTSQQFYQDDAASIYAPSDTTPRNASFYLPKTKRLTAEDRKKSRLSLISNLPGSKGSILISPSPTNISAATATAVSNVFVEEKKISEAVKEFTTPLKKTLSAMILKDKTENNQNQSNNQSKGTDKQKRDTKTQKGDLSTPSEEDKNEIIENRVVELVELPAFLLENTSLTVLSAIPSTKSNLADGATKVDENEKRRQSTPSKTQSLALQLEEKENRQLQLFTKFSFSLKEIILFEKKFSRMSEDGKTARNLLINPSGLSEQREPYSAAEGSVSILPFQGQSQQQQIAEQPTVFAKSNMKYYYSELFECLGDAIRSGVLRCFRIMELSIMPSPTSALLGHSHDNRDSASSIANNPLNRRRSVSNVSGGFFSSRQQTMTSSYDSQVNTRAKKALLESDSISVRNNTPGNTSNTTWNQEQGKNRRGSLIPFSNSDQPMDLSSLFQLLLQSHNPDEHLRTKVYISLSSMVRIDSVDAFLNHVKILFDANELYLQNDSSLLSGQLWDISPLFNSARYLINLFGNNDETSLNTNTNSTFLTGMNGSNLTVPNHSLTGKASVNITTVFSKLKSLQESLKQQLILYHEHLFWTTKMGLLPSSTVSNTEGNPPNAFLTTSSNPLDSALDEMKHFHDRLTEESFYALQSLAGLTYFHQAEHHHHHHHHHQSHSKPQTTKRLPPLRSTSLLQSCEALLAQFMIFLLPKNFALLEFMLRISCLSEVLNKNKLYFKNVQNNYEMYKNCKKLFKALKIQQKLEKELLEISAVDSILTSSPVIQNRNRSNSSGNDSSTCRQQISSVIEELDTLLDKQLHPAGSSSANVEDNKNTFREHSVSPSKDPTSVNPLSNTQGPLRRASYVYFQQTSSAPANSSSLLCDGKYCLEKIKSIIMKSDEIYHRYTVYKESLQSLASYKNAFDSSSSSSSDDDEGDKDGFGSLTDDEEVKRIYSDLELSDNEKTMHNKSGPPSSQRKSFVGSRKVLPTENSPLKQSSSVVLSARKSSVNHEQQSSNREKSNISPQITFHQSQKAPLLDKSKPTKRINHEKLEERKLDKMASELFHYKEDMKKKLSLLTSFINFEETEHFIKAIPNPESLSNKCYEMVYKRDENNYNIATLLLQIKSKKLLTSIYSTWPNLSFEIPSEPDRSSGSFYEGANNNTPGIMTGSSPMMTTMSRSKSFIHKTVSYHDELFPAKPIGGGSSATSAMNSPQKFSNSLQSVSSRVGGSGNTVGGGRSVYSSAAGVDNQSSGSHQTNNIMKHLDYLTSQQEAMQFCYAKDIDLSLFESFHNTKGLRKIGFTLLQLRDSKCFTWNQLLSAGYPLNEIKYLRGTVAASPSTSSLLSGRANQNPHHHDHSFELTVPELRKAGYTIEQCVKAGFNIKAIKSGGFDELQLVQCGLFTTKQLLSAGCDIQRYVLKNFYELTNGKYWNHSDNWNSSLPLSKWYGIKTDSYGHILSIDLRSNELYGCLPESLYLLTTLQSLDLFNNHLRSNFPASYANLVNLKDLWLDGNPELKQNISKQQLQKLLPNCRIRL